jgi:hypothetical protein
MESCTGLPRADDESNGSSHDSPYFGPAIPSNTSRVALKALGKPPRQWQNGPNDSRRARLAFAVFGPTL